VTSPFDKLRVARFFRMMIVGGSHRRQPELVEGARPRAAARGRAEELRRGSLNQSSP